MPTSKKKANLSCLLVHQTLFIPDMAPARARAPAAAAPLSPSKNMLRTTALLSAARATAARCPRTTPCRAYTTSHKKPTGTPSAMAMLAVASMGFAAYSMLAKSREGSGKIGEK